MPPHISSPFHEIAEHEEMESLANSYSKTWLCWQFDRDNKLPIGVCFVAQLLK